MANSIRDDFSGGKTAQQQDPRAAAMERMRQMGIDIPQGMEDDPNALLRHVLQSGRLPQGRLNAAQQVLRRLRGF